MTLVKAGFDAPRCERLKQPDGCFPVSIYPGGGKQTGRNSGGLLGWGNGVMAACFRSLIEAEDEPETPPPPMIHLHSCAPTPPISLWRCKYGS